MSDKAKDTKDKEKPEGKIELPAAKSGGLPTEAKAGLVLVLILLSAFGYMVWQRWDRSRSGADVVQNAPKPDGDSDVAPKRESEPPRQPAEPSRDAFPTAIKEASHEKPLKPQPTAAEFPADFATSTKTENASPVATEDRTSLPTLDVGHATAGKSQPLPEEFDPFEGESKTADAKPTNSKPTNGETDPFADADWDNEPQVTGVPPKTAATTTDLPPEADPFGSPATTPKSPTLPGLEVPAETPTLEVTADPFASTAKTEEPAPKDTDKPVEAEPRPADDFFNLPPTASKNDKPAPAAEMVPDEVTYQEPLPLLEQVPDKKSSASTKPADFGGFEPVPVGHARTESTTRVEAPGELVFPDHPLKPNTTVAANSTPAADPRSGTGVYAVKPNDTYWTISKEVYGTAKYFKALAMFNQSRIANPEQMRPGMQVLVPKASILEASYPTLFPQAAPADPEIVQVRGENGGLATDLSGNTVYRVGKNDTLSQIAQKHLGRSSRWIQIFELNRDKLKNPNDLKIGMILKLPQDASRVKFVSGDADTPRR